MSFAASKEKDGKVILKCQSPFSPSNHSFGINKIDRFDVLKCPGSSGSSSMAKLFTTTTITNPGWVGRVENLRLNIGTSLRWEEPNLAKETYTSKSGRRAFSYWVLTKRKWSEKNKSMHICSGINSKVCNSNILKRINKHSNSFQKQSPRGVLRTLTKFTGKHLCQSLFF